MPVTNEVPLARVLPILRSQAQDPDQIPSYQRTYRLVLSGRVTTRVREGRHYIPDVRAMARELGVTLRDDVIA